VSHEVKLDVFEGPIELLLHLITRRRVDIYDVSLASITDEYLSAMSKMRGLDLESATGFLVVAATLVELKSARLLPSTSEETDGTTLEERDLLLARIVECATYREAGAWLRGRLAAGELFFERSVSMEGRYVGLLPDLLASVSADRLAACAARALAPKPQVALDISHLEPIRASVREAITEIAFEIEGNGRSSFERLCDGRSRIDVVVRFLALLELFKAGAVELDQRGLEDDIEVVWTGEAAARDVAQEAEEYEPQLIGSRR
jgi:segregation and condensation protein A